MKVTVRIFSIDLQCTCIQGFTHFKTSYDLRNNSTFRNKAQEEEYRAR